MIMGTASLAPDPMWDVLEYEVKMFVALKARRRRLPLELDMRNALVEAELLHVRALTEALIDKGKEPDDLGLAYFITTDNRSPVLKSVIQALATTYGVRNDGFSSCWQINKLVAHLTKKRLAMHEYEACLNIMEPVLECVLDLVAGALGRAWNLWPSVVVLANPTCTAATNAYP